MKRGWTHTLAWIAAVIAAVLLAFSGPDILHFSPLHVLVPQGGSTPR